MGHRPVISYNGGQLCVLVLDTLCGIVTICRLFTLKITEEEVKALLDHTDSPYIRAVRSCGITWRFVHCLAF